MDVDFKGAWETVKDAVVSFGWVKGTLTIFFWVAHFWIYREYRGRLKDRQDEINRIAAENHEYRDRFIGLLDKYFKPSQQALREGTDEPAAKATTEKAKAAKKGRKE
ncbi:MAG: hypothetical protein ACJ74Q_08980 [Pyrinomonadaceae bacterium]